MYNDLSYSSDLKENGQCFFNFNLTSNTFEDKMHNLKIIRYVKNTHI